MNLKFLTHIFFLFVFLISCDRNLKTNQVSKDGMVFIQGGIFSMGAGDDESREDEFPSHLVEVSSFWMDISEVTNKQFREFIDETGYVTTAERKINWDEIKEFVPPGTPKPHDSLLEPSSLVFQEIKTDNLQNYSNWWSLIRNANWKQPFGKDSNIEGKGNHPVIHISWDDAMAYAAEVADKTGESWRLPTKAEMPKLLETKCINPAANPFVFPDLEVANFWTKSKGLHQDIFRCSVYTYQGRVFCRQARNIPQPFLLVK